MYEELIKAMRVRADTLYNASRLYDSDAEDAAILYKAADAIEELQAGEKKFLRNISALEMENENLKRGGRWIPVTEEPPLKVGDEGYNGYLIYGIYDGNGYYEVADYTTDKFDNVPYFHVDGEYEPDVTHWMPLPTPPKEEET